jgi:signal transduction histidine kinase
MVPWFPWFNVELVSLAFIPVGYALYLAAVSENRMKHILSNLSKFNLSIAALSIIFGFVELIHLKDFLLFIQLGALITLGFSLVALVKSMLLGRKSSKIIFVGTVVAGVGIIHDILLSINVIESTLLLGNIAGLFLFSSMSIAAGVEYKESFVRARKLQAEREKQKAKSLKDRMEAIANLAAGVAHEINNPLAIIQASAYKIDREVKLSGEEVLIDTGKTYMKKIKSSIDRIHGITQSLVLVSKDSDDGQVQVPLSVVITKPMEDAKVMAADLGVKLFSNNFPGDVYIQCMLSYLEKAFTGLLLNAVEAASSTDEKWVKIEFHKGEEDVQIRIIDSGKGIPPKVLEKIFQPFYTSKDIGSGVGMGLSIASRIIKNLKGNLWVDDMAPNTTFVIDLPAVVAKKKKKKSDNNVHVNYIDKAS